MTQAFILNIKPGGKDMVPEALESDVIIIGWGKSKGLLKSSLTRTDVRRILREDHYSNETTFRKAGAAAHTVWPFLREMVPGDVVVVPHKKQFYVGVVSSQPDYKFVGGSSTRYYQRQVRWLNDRKPFLRADAPKALGLQMMKRPTLSSATDVLGEIRAFLAAHSLNLEDGYETDDVARDIGEIRRAAMTVTEQESSDSSQAWTRTLSQTASCDVGQSMCSYWVSSLGSSSCFSCKTVEQIQ